MDNFTIHQLREAVTQIKARNAENVYINRFDENRADKRKLYKFYKTYAFSHVETTNTELSNKNPHARQNSNVGYNLQYFRTLTNDTPRLKYRRRKGEAKSCIHWGQRKLLLMEIEFLTKNASSEDIVVYAGAAPGNHIPYLSSLFPTLEFALYDPNDFAIKQGGKIRIFQQYFTDKDAKVFSDRDDVIFISDVRTANPDIMDASEIELRVEEDNKKQLEWYTIINPKKSMFKFRLPWLVPFEKHNGEWIPSPHDSKSKGKEYKWVTRGGEKFKYLAGDIYIQPFGPQSTTETRLHVDMFDRKQGPKFTIYDNTEYEEQMFYFNTKARPSLYYHGERGEGIDDCYDCATEVKILDGYKQNGTVKTDMSVEEISKEISRVLGSRRLYQPQPPPNHRKFKPTKLIEQGYVPPS